MFLSSSYSPVAADVLRRRDGALLNTINPNLDPATTFAMENALAPAAPADPLAAGSAAPTTLLLSRRRSHLDSASYRTLSRLFSHFLHLNPSQHAAPAHLGIEPAAANPIGDASPQGASAAPKDAEFEQGKDIEEQVAAASTSGVETPAHVVVEAAAGYPIADLDMASQESAGHEVAGVELVEGLEDMVAEGIACRKTPALVEELGGEAELMGTDEVLRSMEASLEGEIEESAELAVANDDEHLLLDTMMSKLSGLIGDASGGTMSMQNCGVSRGGPQNHGKIAEGVKEFVYGIEESTPVGNSDHQSVDGGGFEEGEIEGDMQTLDADESGDSELEAADDEKLEEDFATRGSGENESSDHGIRCLNSLSMPGIKGSGDLVLNKEGDIKADAQMHVPRAQAVGYDEVVEWNETPLHDAEAPRPGKRKRIFTEERKAKKTKNKRVKRALQREADGVKRLKLAPIIKPKVVRYCHFYLHGKCQQGNVCKFSHDTTPLTKSKPCTHFARGSCLKGDDCPYDHELSKYPCHNFLGNGMCLRGDKCKFSHVAPTADDSSTKDAKKSDASLVSEKLTSKEQNSSQKISTVHDGEPVASAPTKHYSILKTLGSISKNAQKASAHMPKGVQFLAFSKGRSDSSILHQDAPPPGNFVGPQAAEGDKNAQPNRHRSAARSNENSSKEASSHPISEQKKTSLSADSIAVLGSVSTQHEVSEASRILQEFLFGAGN